MGVTADLSETAQLEPAHQAVGAGDFKTSPVGPIPADWHVSTIGDITDVDPENLPASTPGGYRFNYISLDNVEVGSLTSYSEKSFATAPSRARRVLRHDDVLMSTVRPNLQAHLHFRSQVQNAVCSTGFAVLRPKPKHAVSGYVYAHLFARQINSQIEKMLAGSNYPAINGRDVKQLLIPCPPTTREQAAIADALFDVDRLIESLDALIMKKRDIKQATMQQLLTGKTRLPGFAKDWEPRPLATAGKCYRGVSYDPEHDLSSTDMDFTVRLLRSNNVQEAVIQLSDLQYVHSRRVSAQQLLRDGDLVLCMANGSRDLVGKAAHFESTDEYEYTFGAFMGCFRTDPVAADPRFIGHLLQTHDFRQYIGVILSGSSINNLKPSDIEAAVFAMPCINEQEAIATVISDMDEEIDALQRCRAKTLVVKQGMMQQLLTGRIRLLTPEGAA